MLNNFVDFEKKITKHSGIDPCEKGINIPGGHAWRYFFMTCSKLEAMAIYLVKQACGNDIMACKEELSQEVIHFAMTGVWVKKPS